MPGLRCELTAIPGITPSSVAKVLPKITAPRGILPATGTRLVSGGGRQHKGLVFPAVVNDFEITDTINFGDYDSVGAGSFSTRRAGGATARELRDLPITVYATNVDHIAGTNEPYAPPFVQEGSPSTWADLYDRLKVIAHSRFPVHLRAVVDGNADVEVSMHVTIRELRMRLTPGQPEARYFSLTFKEYRDVEEGEETVRYGRVRGSGDLPKRYALRDGENVTLGELAARFYGAYTLWTLIRDAKGNGALRKKNVPASRPLSEFNVRSVWIPAVPPRINDRRAAV